MKLRPTIFGIVVSMLFLLVPSLRAQDGLRGALSREATMVHQLLGFEQHLAAADFDNDQLPDGALLLPAGFSSGERSFRVELHITSGNGGVITFSTAERGLSISALDVNRDGAPDIVIEKAFTHQRLDVYLNDGHGAFHKGRLEDFTAPDPSAPKWQSSTEQFSPSVCLPATRSSEAAGIQNACAAYLDDTRDCGLSFDAPRVQSPASAASPSRGPPSLLAL
ncbi:FG-GAP repeat domain-containing protein [Occallatibacter riparius]|uniref:VCBS repeat-containing protein n=1 Tax=Occallatibacter riparius TaxID=1002689 RepID=A0A9J7BPM2_9BACT|nr:VCBS repeat-containing protein [Occallatibacter riparius]UWZ84481.1 VCBS repeat-containing protein [Occallatibacter riparius]